MIAGQTNYINHQPLLTARHDCSPIPMQMVSWQAFMQFTVDISKH